MKSDNLLLGDCIERMKEIPDGSVTNTEIGKIVRMDKSVVGKVVDGKSKKTDHGVYFSDLTLEKALCLY